MEEMKEDNYADSNVEEGQPVRGKKQKLNMDLYQLGEKELGEDVIQFHDLSKVYKLKGRDETVIALKSASLTPEGEFYPIK